MNKVGVIFIGLGKYFGAFFSDYRCSVDRFLLPGRHKRLYVVTDPANAGCETLRDPDVYTAVVEDPELLKWPMPTLLRFEFICNMAVDLRRETSQVVFLDADCCLCTEIEQDDLFPPDASLFAVQHPWCLDQVGCFERNPESRAFVHPEQDDNTTYWQACFWGGAREAVLRLSRELDRRIKADLAEGIIALWHDESHLNRYLIDHKQQVHTLGPEYACPFRLHQNPDRRRQRGIPPAKVIHRQGQIELRV